MIIKMDIERLIRPFIFSVIQGSYYLPRIPTRSGSFRYRNHGFLMFEPGKWSLSPAYDINPVPEIDRSRGSKTPITEAHDEPSISAALDAAPRFGLQPAEAKKIL